MKMKNKQEKKQIIDMSTKRKIIIICITAVVILALCASAIYTFRDFFFETDILRQTIENGGISVHFIDVGQADCVLIMTPNGNMLIDSGTNSSEYDLKSYLNELDITSFEYFVITHPHDDHIGGADMIVRDYDVENVIMTGAKEDAVTYTSFMSIVKDKNINVIEAVSGQSFFVGEVKNTILAPNKSVGSYEETNSTSIVLKCEFGECSLILTGDAETDSEQEMIDTYGDMLDCDILKLGHHGSKTSSSYKFLEITSPQYAIATCGKDNTYGHPSAEVTYRLNLFGIELLRTDKYGSIVFVCDGKQFEYIN